MANIRAIHSVGNSIVTYLRNTYPDIAGGAAMPDCDFALLSMAELATPPDANNRLALSLYRITVNEHMRQQRPDRTSAEQPAPLGLDLHFLLSAWVARRPTSSCRWPGRCASSTCTRSWMPRRCRPRPAGRPTR